MKVWGQATSLPAFTCLGRPTHVPQSLVCPEAVVYWPAGHSTLAAGKTVLPAKPRILRCSQELAGATPAKVSGSCLFNPSLDLGGLWRRRNAVGKMALALQSRGPIPWQGRDGGPDGTTIIGGSLMTSLKVTNADLHPLTQQIRCAKGHVCKEVQCSVCISRRLAAAHAHRQWARPMTQGYSEQQFPERKASGRSVQ